MTTRLRSLRTGIWRVLFLVVVAIVTGACPPPADDDASPVADTPSPAVANPTGAGGQDTGVATPPGAAAGSSEGTGRAQPTDTTRPVTYERLRGGVFVPRCPACGDVQPRGAEKCAGCGQAMSPWRKETLCTRCVGDGRCDHCGDDRICLACEGDGACPYCAGTGKTPGKGSQCLECGGGGRCVSCRGDGRRENVTGDFLPTGGWLPGACSTCIDGSGLCPECGSTGKDASGGVCATCKGSGACADCGGEGACGWCGADGACVVCDGGGREVLNGAPRGPDERMRSMRTSGGSFLSARVETAPTSQGIRIVRTDAGRQVATTLPRSQVGALSWWLVVQDFAPGWDGRTVPDAVDLAKFRSDLADLAVESAWWPLALRSLGQAIALDPVQAPALRLRVLDVETKRVEDWVKRADAANKAGDRERAAQLLEMVVFKGRGTPVATRADLQLLQVRKDREAARAKLTEAEKVRGESDAKSTADRAGLRARMRLDRARQLLERANGLAAGDPTADRVLSRAEFAAWSSRRLLEQAEYRAPAATVAWATAPGAVVTEARRVTANVLEAWATRAIAGGRYDFGLRLARRGLAADVTVENLKLLASEAEAGLARSGVLQGSPPPGKR